MSKRRSGRNPLDLFWGLGSLFFLAITFAIGGYYLFIFIEPTNSLNFFPPDGKPVVQVPTTVPTDTPVATAEGADLTATSEAIASATATDFVIVENPTATATNETLPTATDFIISGPTATQPALGTPTYVVQDGSPAYLKHIVNGCDGLYIVGNVFDENGIPVVFIEIRLGGLLDGQPLYEESAISGNAQHWGLSGYEIKISDTMIDSYSTAFVQMYDLETESPASEIIFLETFDDCSKNTINLTFVKTSQ